MVTAVEPVAIVVVDRSGTIRFWNPGAESLFGHRESEVVGATLDVIVPPHLRDRHWSGFQPGWRGSATTSGWPSSPWRAPMARPGSSPVASCRSEPLTETSPP